MNQKRIIKDALVLFIITLISGLSLGYVNKITVQPIKQQEDLAIQEAYKAVFSDAVSFDEDTIINAVAGNLVLEAAGINTSALEEVRIAKDQNGEVVGYVMNVINNEGYGGDVKIAVGIRVDGTVNGYSVLSLNETAGLGMKAQDAAFKDQFSNKQVEEFVVTKNGAKEENEIDAISGATITSNAVTNAVNASIVYFNSIGGSVDESK